MRRVLIERAIVDRPGERTSHTGDVPRGGGLVLVPVVLAAWAVAGALTGAAPVALIALLGGAGLLFWVSWRDDLGGLPPVVRLVAQLVAAGSVYALSAPGSLIGDGAPSVFEAAVVVTAWVGFLNIFNFMDGIDGIAGTETVTLGLGAAVVVAIAGGAPPVALFGLTAAAAALGFLRWNWHPAKVFMGDSGSVPLGFLLGWLLIALAADGLWAPALILPLYYLADGGLTLLKRLVRGEKIWHAHREHFYQRALSPGDDHRPVVRLVAFGNVALVVCAGVAAMGAPWPALASAGMVVFVMLSQLEGRARARARSGASAP